MKNFRVQWQKEYLTSLQEQHSFLIQTSECMKIHDNISRVEIHEELKRCFFALPCLLYTLCSKDVLKECMHGYIQFSLTIFPKAQFFWARCILEHKKFKKTTQKKTIILSLFTNLVPRSYRIIVNLGNLQPLGHGRYGYKTKQLSLFLKFDWQVLRDYSWRKENQKEREQF